MPKGNPLLNKLKQQAEAKARAEYNAKLAIHSEIELIALLYSAHKDLGVGPGRAKKVLDGFLESKHDVAKAIVKETTEDSQGDFWITQRDIARDLKRILGAENWQECKVLFPTLKYYWDRD